MSQQDIIDHFSSGESGEETSTAIEEKNIHSAFAHLAQQIADQYGMKVNRVYFEWISSSTVAKPQVRIYKTSVDSDCVVTDTR